MIVLVATPPSDGILVAEYERVRTKALLFSSVDNLEHGDRRIVSDGLGAWVARRLTSHQLKPAPIPGRTLDIGLNGATKCTTERDVVELIASMTVQLMTPSERTKYAS